MNDIQKKKRNFRNSKKWKEFKKVKRLEQNSTDPVTGKKLLKGANLHHMDLNEEHYEDLSHKENFVFVNHQTHETIHFLYRYFKEDPAVIDRLRSVLEQMKAIDCTSKSK